MGTMSGLAPLKKLFLRTNDIIQEKNDEFEQHFLWLEEVVAEARQTLASPEMVLLPKTPSAPKRTRKVIKEDAENLPPPAIAQSTRRGRLCSRLALEKIQEQGRLEKVKKLRRPSSPIDQSLPSTPHKDTTTKTLHLNASPSPSSRAGEEPDNSLVPGCERVLPSSPRNSQESSRQSRKPKRLSTSQKDNNSSKKHTSSLQEDENTSQEDPLSIPKDDSSPENNDSISPQKTVTFQQKEDTVSHKDDIHQNHSFPQTKSSSSPMEVKISSKEVTSESSDISLKDVSNQKKETVIEKRNTDDRLQNTTKATEVPEVIPQEEDEIHLQLDESFDECTSVDEPEEEQDIELMLESPEGLKSKNGTKEKKDDTAFPNSSPQLSSIPTPIDTCLQQEVVEMQDISPATSPLPQSVSAPVPRVTCSKQRVTEVLDASPSLNCLSQSPAVPAPRVTRTKQKVTEVQEISPEPDSPPHLPAVPAPRVTRTKQRAMETQDAVLAPESFPHPFAAAPRITRTKQRTIEVQDLPESLPQPPSAPVPRVTRTKQKAIEKEIPPSSFSPQPAPRVTRTKQKAMEMKLHLSSPETTNRKLRTEDDEENTRSKPVVTKTTQQESDGRNTNSCQVKDSGVFSFGVKKDLRSSVESVSSEVSCAPSTHPSPVRITRSKMSKPQPPHQHSPEKVLPAFVHCQGPLRKSPSNRKFAGHQDGDKDSEGFHSPVRVVRHTPDRTGKVVQARFPVLNAASSGRITPSIISRMQPFYTASSASSSSSASSEHRRIVKRTAGTPGEGGRRPANIITNVSSFIKSQPTRPTKEEIETQRIQDLQRKKEYEEDSLRKKEQLLRAKAEEKKRCNEERMRRAKETRMKKEQLAEAAKEQQKRERQQREARQREEEEEHRRLRQQQLAKKKAEEEAKKAAKLKEETEKKKQEEEKRKKLEEEKRRQKLEEEARRKLEEDRRNYLAEQRIALEEQQKLKTAKAQLLMREKEEAEQFKLKENLRILREKELQAKRQQEAKAVMSTTYICKENSDTTSATTSTKNSGGPLNTTYTMPVATSGKTDSYEMTPVQPKRNSSSLNDYNIHDLQSDDSTDDDTSPKKKIPDWATKTRMRAALVQQEHYPPKMDHIFPPNSLLILPDLSRIFPQQKRRFRKRTSSAIWETPPSKFFRVNSPV